MATTANDVYEKALVLMDAQSDSDKSEYNTKTLPILNTLANECYPYSDTWEKPEAGKTAICPAIYSLEDEMPLDDKICREILPFGLGGLLLMDENPSTANFLWAEYKERLAALRNGVGMRVDGSTDIFDVYGDKDGNSSYYYNKFSYWGC